MQDCRSHVKVNQSQVPDQPDVARFEQAVLPHLTAAYNLARWLTGNDHDAEDVVQESYCRAVQFFAGFRGTNPRAWLLTVVRNCCATWRQRQHGKPAASLDESIHSPASEELNPERLVLRRADIEELK